MKESTPGSTPDRNRLKIALVFDDSLDRSDGVQQQLKLLGKWLAGQGHSVRYLVGQTTLGDIHGQRVYSLSRNLAIKANQNRLSLPLTVDSDEVEEIFSRERFDAVHVMLPFSPVLGLAAVKTARRRKLPLIGTFHTQPATGWQLVGSWFYGRWLRRYLRDFQALVSVSEPTRRYARACFGVDSQVIPNFIDSKRFAAGRHVGRDAGGRYNVVFLGRLVKRKGPQHLLAAAVCLKDNPLDIRWRIGGAGPLEGRLRDLVAGEGLADRVEFAGFVAEEDKPDFLSSADLAVFPATGGEAFGIVLLEAMAAGALTLGGDNPGYLSVIGERAELVITPDNPSQLAERIVRLLSDQRLRRELLEWQRKQVGRYDISAVGPTLLKLYRLPQSHKLVFLED